MRKYSLESDAHRTKLSILWVWQHHSGSLYPLSVCTGHCNMCSGQVNGVRADGQTALRESRRSRSTLGRFHEQTLKMFKHVFACAQRTSCAEVPTSPFVLFPSTSPSFSATMITTGRSQFIEKLHKCVSNILIMCTPIAHILSSSVSWNTPPTPLASAGCLPRRLRSPATTRGHARPSSQLGTSNRKWRESYRCQFNIYWEERGAGRTDAATPSQFKQLRPSTLLLQLHVG